jgi:hypothetical protein
MVNNMQKEQNFIVGYNVQMPSVEGIMSGREQSAAAMPYDFYCKTGPNVG